jgi:hypothetical protein
VIVVDWVCEAFIPPEIVNAAEEDPAAIVTAFGTFAMVGVALERFTVTPPEGAGPDN